MSVVYQNAPLYLVKNVRIVRFAAIVFSYLYNKTISVCVVETHQNLNKTLTNNLVNVVQPTPGLQPNFGELSTRMVVLCSICIFVSLVVSHFDLVLIVPVLGHCIHLTFEGIFDKSVISYITI